MRLNFPFLSRRGSESTARGLGALALAATCAAHAAAGWSTFGGDAQHTGLSATAAQPLNAVRWSTPVNISMPSPTDFIHYGSPLITPANTVIIPIKTSTGEGWLSILFQRKTKRILCWRKHFKYMVHFYKSDY